MKLRMIILNEETLYSDACWQANLSRHILEKNYNGEENENWRNFKGYSRNMERETSRKVVGEKHLRLLIF
jgi:hypothetical protein